MPKDKQDLKLDSWEMVGGCCVCSDDRGWAENPLVYCDGTGCNVAVHQACYGIVTIPSNNWYCRKCETPNVDQVKCELCPWSSGALKRSDSGGWAHVVCALYIPEVSFGNVTTMEPIITNQVPQERFNKTCYICEERGKGAISRVGACMQCNRSGCRQVFHVTCAQAQGLLCEEAGNYQDNVKYCGYCHHHYNKLKKGSHVKAIAAYRGQTGDDEAHKHSSKRKLSKGNKAGGEQTDGVADDTSVTNGDSPELKTSSTTHNKKRKSNRSSTPGTVEEGSRPTTPTPPNTIRPISPANGGVKVGSIVVQVPLEAAGVESQRGTVPPSTVPASTVPASTVPLEAASPVLQPTSPSVSDSSSSHHAPAKRSRSESTESKGDKRRSKRSSGGTVSLASAPGGGNTAPSGHTAPSVANVSGAGATSTVSQPSTSNQHARHRNKSPIRTRVGNGEEVLIIKEEKDLKVFENGLSGSAAHMLGNELAPGSNLNDTLSQEVEAHSIYSKPSASHVGPHFPRQHQSRSTGNSMSWGSSTANMPQTLEQLLERQWEQGSQFLMEQAHHFDIASLLSCLHQLKAENAQLEEHVNSLQTRRDNLLAVNARLAIPLVSQPHQTSGGNNVSRSSGATASVTNNTGMSNANLASAVLTNSTAGNTAQVVENGIPSTHEQYRLSTLQRVERGSSYSAGTQQGSQGGGGGTQQGSVVVRHPSRAHTPSYPPSFQSTPSNHQVLVRRSGEETHKSTSAS